MYNRLGLLDGDLHQEEREREEVNCTLTCSQGELATRTQEDEGRSIWLAAQGVCHTRVSDAGQPAEARVR